jgi:hypothetical protein
MKMDIKNIEKEVDKDLTITVDNLVDISHNAPKLHNKYSKKLNNAVFLMKKYNNDYNKKYVELFKFYKTKYKILLTTKGEVDAHIAGDKEMIVIKQRVDYYTQIVKYLESVIKNINQISFHVRNSIEYQKFMAGEL